MEKDLTKMAVEKTFVMVKPDGVQRGIVGEIVSRLEKRGLKIVAMKMVKPSIDHIDQHYPQDEAWIARLGEKGEKVFTEVGITLEEAMGTADKLEAGKMVRQWLIDYMTEAPVVAMVVEGIHAREMVRKLAGNTLPAKAEIGTIRGDYSVDSPTAANLNKRAIKNILHASETAEEAEHEIQHWFSEEEIYEYNRADHSAMF